MNVVKKSPKKRKLFENWAALAIYLTALSSIVVYLIVQLLYVMKVG